MSNGEECMQQSEIARLCQQLESEYEAMKRGLNDLAQGTAIHSFISARMARVESYHGELVKQVGEYEATQIVCELYNKAIR